MTTIPVAEGDTISISYFSPVFNGSRHETGTVSDIDGQAITLETGLRLEPNGDVYQSQPEVNTQGESRVGTNGTFKLD